MEAVRFKTSILGGFRRKDVIDYIAKSALEAKRCIDSLREDTDGLEKENRSLRDELASLGSERDRLDTLLRENVETQERLRAELDCVAGEISALRNERDMLKNRVEALRPQAEQFTAIKSNLAEMELDARYRAESYDAEVRGKADAYERETRCAINAMLDDVRVRCNEALASLTSSCGDIARCLDESRISIATLPDAFYVLRQELDTLRGTESNAERLA